MRYIGESDEWHSQRMGTRQGEPERLVHAMNVSDGDYTPVIIRI